MARYVGVAGLLIVLTIGVFWRSHDYGFVWDDEINIYDNPYLNSDTPPNILRFWQKPYKNLYVPLTYTVWATIARFSKVHTTPGRGNLDPRLFHIANLVVHLLSVIVVFTILRLMVPGVWAAGAGALLFALHPLQVEAVAWATGMKDVLCGLLSFVALWQYLAYATAASTATVGHQGKETESSARGWFHFHLDRKTVHYLAATLAFVLALLAKPTAVVVPAMAWLLDYWTIRRSLRQSMLGLVAWVVLTVPFIVLTQSAQPKGFIHFITPLWARPFVAGDALAFYLYKLVMPLSLGPDYGRQPEWVLNQWWVFVMWLVPCGLLLVTWLYRDKKPWLVASVGIFVVGVLPVSGLVPFTFQYISTVADRYLYLSMLGAALALAWFLSEVRWRVVAVVCVPIYLGWLVIASAVQVPAWRDAERLWTHALTVNPRSSLAHYNLGNMLSERGELEAAIEHYRQAAQSDPASTDIINNLGNVYVKQGKLEEAMEQYRRAIRINPRDDYAHKNLAEVLAVKGHFEEAIDHYQKALEINPNFVEAYVHLAELLLVRGYPDRAIPFFRQALRMAPEFAEAHVGLGRALKQSGETDEAVQHYEQALRIMKSHSAASKQR